MEKEERNITEEILVREHDADEEVPERGSQCTCIIKELHLGEDRLPAEFI